MPWEMTGSLAPLADDHLVQDTAVNLLLNPSARIHNGPVYARENLATNPSFESDPESNAGTNATVVRSSDMAMFGTHSMKVTAIDSSWYRFRPTPGMAVSGSQQYAISVWVRTFGADQPLLLQVDWYSGGTFISVVYSTPITVTTTGWTRLVAKVTVPASGVDRMNVFIRNSTGSAAGNGFYADGLLIENSSIVRDYFDGSTPIRNLHPDPFVKTGAGWQTSRWFGTGAGTHTVETGPGAVGNGFFRKTWTARSNNPGDTGFQVRPPDVDRTVVPGEQISLSGWMRSSKSGHSFVARVGFWIAATGTTVYHGGTHVISVANTWQRVEVTLTVPAGATLMTPLLDVSSSGPGWEVGNTLDGDGVVLERSDVPTPYVYEGTGDYTFEWSGDAHASSSRMVAPQAWGVPARDSQRMAHASTNPLTGTPALRVTPRNTANYNNDTFANIVSLVAAQAKPNTTYTLCARVTLSESLKGTLHAQSRRFVVAAGSTTLSTQVIESPPNEAGVHVVRVRFTTTANGSYWTFMRPMHGATEASGSADIWYDQLTLVEGEYDGPPFDGASVNGRWQAIPDQSKSELDTYPPRPANYTKPMTFIGDLDPQRTEHWRPGDAWLAIPTSDHIDAGSALNRNPSFADWDDATPSYWTHWGSTSTAPLSRETQLTRSSPGAVRFTLSATEQFGLAATSGPGYSLEPLPLDMEYVTMEVDFMLVSGSLSGSAIRLDWTGMTGGSPYGWINFKAEVPNPQLGKWYRVTKMVRRPTHLTGTQTGWTTYVFGNYAGDPAVQPQATKDLIIDRVAFRRSSNEEIASYLAVKPDDARLTDSRTPAGAAGGVLAGTYPNPTLAASTDATINFNQGLRAFLGSAKAAADLPATYPDGVTYHEVGARGDWPLGYCLILTVKQNAFRTVQMLAEKGTGRVMFRTAGDNVWSDWREHVTTTDPRLSDARTPLAHGHALTDASITGTLPYAQLPVGTAANTVAAGNDSRFTNSRTPSGTASGDLSGSYPNPTLASSVATAVNFTNGVRGNITARADTDPPSAYPLGFSTFSTGDAAGTNWPSSGYLTVATFNQNGTSRAFQLASSKDSNRIYLRNFAGTDGWTSWKELLSHSNLTDYAKTADVPALAATQDDLVVGSIRNGSFSIWTATAPAWWVGWGSTPSKETTLARTGPHAARWVTDSATDAGMYVSSANAALSDLPLNLEYVTLEIDFQLVSGSLNGAGLRLDWTGQGSYGFLPLKNEVPSPQLGKWYRVTRTVRRSAGGGAQTGWTLYCFANYQSTNPDMNVYGGKAVKDIVIDRVSARPASPAEVSALTYDSDPRLTDARTPLPHGHALTDANITGVLPYAQLPVGTAASTVAAGNDSRFSNARTPTGTAGGDLTGTYPNPSVGTTVFKARGGGQNTGDWNAILTPGAYGVGLATDWTNVTNGPFASGTNARWGTLLVYMSGNQVVQEYLVHSANNEAPRYYRSKYNASDWTAWTQLALHSDPRFTDARTPLPHGHALTDANITGTLPYAQLPVGTAANTVAAGNDSRFTDARTPTAHTHSGADINSGKVPIAQIPTVTSGTSSSTGVPLANDSRLSNARTPTGTAGGDLTGTYPNPTISAAAKNAIVASVAVTVSDHEVLNIMGVY